MDRSNALLIGDLLERRNISGASPIEYEVARKAWEIHIQAMDKGISEAISQVQPLAKVGIVGAGPCYDFTLPALLTDPRIGHIDLSDIRDALVRQGIERAVQDISQSTLTAANDVLSRVSYVPLDITGMLGPFIASLENLASGFIAQYREDVKTGYLLYEDRIEELFVRQLERFQKGATMPDDLKYDVTVSDCVFSQLLNTVKKYCEDFYENIVRCITHYSVEVIQNKKKEFSRNVMTKVEAGMFRQHVGNLQRISREGGRIFIASDQRSMTYPQDRDLPKKLTPGNLGVIASGVYDRMTFKCSELRAMVESVCPSMHIIHSQKWIWQRMPGTRLQRIMYEDCRMAIPMQVLEEVHGVLIRS